MWDAKGEWINLGLQLNIKERDLKVIQTDSENTKSCFREMLSTWLKMIDPPPSWEDLLTALEHCTVQCGDLAKKIRERFDMPKKQESATTIGTYEEPLLPDLPANNASSEY